MALLEEMARYRIENKVKNKVKNARQKSRRPLQIQLQRLAV
jgi:hypothetical protein